MFLRKKNKNNIDQFYHQIEQAVQDDLAMFLEFGEEYFTLEELEALHQRWESEYQMTDKLRGRFVILCTSSFMLIPIAGIFLMVGLGELLPIFLISFPIFFLAGLAGFLFLYFKYGRVAYQENIGRRLRFAIRNKRKRSGSGYPKGY